jgi:predicted Rossmann-fold nucleotide-binding protein
MSGDVDGWLREIPGGPYPFRTGLERLYSGAELYRGFDPDRPGTLQDSFDARAAHWLTGGGPTPRRLSTAETIAARLHDTSVDRLVAALVREHRPSVALMGSHSISREHPAFLQFVLIARELQRKGYLVISGGGPGLMEAANFGAFLGPCADEVLVQALEILKHPQCNWNGEDWLRSAARARAFVLQHMPGAGPDADWASQAPAQACNLGIPTWYYGREPPNLFATHVGKYFFNSLREDGLVSVATAGIIFGMGDAGTVQEVFQSASLNYYPPAGRAATPMIFVGSEYWEPERPLAGPSVDLRPKPVLALIRAMAAQAEVPFEECVEVYETVQDVVGAIVRSTAAARDRIAEDRLAAI